MTPYYAVPEQHVGLPCRDKYGNLGAPLLYGYAVYSTVSHSRIFRAVTGREAEALVVNLNRQQRAEVAA